MALIRIWLYYLKEQNIIEEEGKEFLFQQIFRQLSDPRRRSRGNFRHQLPDIVLLVISAVLCGADDWEQIADFGAEQQQWLRRYGEFRHGIPSHDTINRVISAIAPSEIESCFKQWVNGLRADAAEELIAIDGKTIRNSHHGQKAAVHIVSAYATQSGLCLGQVATGAKSNEITAIPALIALLDIKGCTVSVDAMGCQRNIARKIKKEKGEYILAVKGNQPTLEEGIQDTVRFHEPADYHEDIDCDHGRIETRKCSVYNNLDMIEGKEKWTGMESVIKIESERTMKSSGKTASQTRYYISSLKSAAKEFNRAIRYHWAIENNLHWCLDVAFGEDMSRKRRANIAHNFNLVRKIVMSMLKKDVTRQAGIKRKRAKALQNEQYRETLLYF
jgi:predicted transposase YbfD/YdcC